MRNKFKKLCGILLIAVVILSISTLAIACNEQQHPTNPVNPDTSDDNAFGEWIIERDATCVDAGLKYRTNKKGERQEEVIPAKGHSYGEWTIVKAATKSEEGLKQSKCSRCDDVQEKIISALVDGTNGLEYTYWSSKDMYYITGAGEAVDVKDLVLPAQYKGKTVIYVYKDSLNDLPNLETVTFAENSEYIYIYPNAFKGCKKLRSVEIPEKITYLSTDFATGCDSLREVNVSENNQSFCSSDGIVYSKDMKSLVVYPQCKKGEYKLPVTLTSVTYKDIFNTTNYPLSNAYGITSFSVDSGNESFATDARGILYSKDMKKLIAYPLANDTADELIIDSEVLNTIEAYSFANNKYLNSVKVINGSGYKNVNGYAFYDTAIQYLELEGISTLDTYAIFGNDNLQNVVFNSGKTTKFGIHYYSMVSNPNLKKVVLPHVLDESYAKGVLCSDDPFWGCTSLEDISFEQGECAYVSVDGAVYTKDMQCLMFIPHAKTSLTLPETLKTISTTALKYNESLTYEISGGLKYYQNFLVGVSDEDITEATVKEGTVGIAAKGLSGLTLNKLSLPESLKYLSYRAIANTNPTNLITSAILSISEQVRCRNSNMRAE